MLELETLSGRPLKRVTAMHKAVIGFAVLAGFDYREGWFVRARENRPSCSSPNPSYDVLVKRRGDKRALYIGAVFMF